MGIPIIFDLSSAGGGKASPLRARVISPTPGDYVIAAKVGGTGVSGAATPGRKRSRTGGRVLQVHAVPASSREKEALELSILYAALPHP
jgi:hypothetical protein